MTENVTTSEFDSLYVSFEVDHQLLGVPVRVVQEVLNPQDIAPVPRARNEIAGLLNLRGQIVTAVSLRTRLGLPDLPEEQRAMNVVVQHQGEPFSILVDDVGDVIDVSNQRMDPIPPTLDATWREVTTGVFRLENRLMVIVSVPEILRLSA